MIVKVIKPFFDTAYNKILRKEKEILDYKDEKRVKELIKKGFAKPIKIVIVEEKKSKSRSQK